VAHLGAGPGAEVWGVAWDAAKVGATLTWWLWWSYPTGTALGPVQSLAESAWSLPLIAELAAAVAAVRGNITFSHQYTVLQELIGLLSNSLTHTKHN
jgi:hypothetical protein